MLARSRAWAEYHAITCKKARSSSRNRCVPSKPNVSTPTRRPRASSGRQANAPSPESRPRISGLRWSSWLRDSIHTATPSRTASTTATRDGVSSGRRSTSSSPARRSPTLRERTRLAPSGDDSHSAARLCRGRRQPHVDHAVDDLRGRDCLGERAGESMQAFETLRRTFGAPARGAVRLEAMQPLELVGAPGAERAQRRLLAGRSVGRRTRARRPPRSVRRVRAAARRRRCARSRGAPSQSRDSGRHSRRPTRGTSACCS